MEYVAKKKENENFIHNLKSIDSVDEVLRNRSRKQVFIFFSLKLFTDKPTP